MKSEKNETVETLKRSVASYKSANTMLKRKVDELTKDVERYKALDAEGDKLNEKRLSENESMKIALDAKDKVIKEKEGVIRGLNEQVGSLSKQVMSLNDTLVKKSTEIQDLNALLEYERLPWWKKILMH